MLARRTIYSQSSQRLHQKLFKTPSSHSRFWVVRDTCHPHIVLVKHHYAFKTPVFPDRFRY